MEINDIVNDKTYTLYLTIAKELVANNFRNFKGIYLKYYPSTSDLAAESSSSRLLRCDKFKRALEEVLNEVSATTLITDDYVLKNILKIVETTKNDRDKLNALQLLGKFLNLWKEGQPTQVTNIYQKYEEELRQRFDTQQDRA